jgi:SSS family solute:Na+ symporter
LNIGKLATAVIVVLGILWIPIMQKIGGGVMYQYLQNVQSYIAPPVVAVFLLGILWKRVNAQASITTLLAGLFLLILRLGSEIYFQQDISHFRATGEQLSSGILYEFASVNFSHMAIFMFIFSVALCISVSLATDPPNYKLISGLSFGTLTAEDKELSKESYSTLDVVLSVLLVVIVVSILAYFTG